MHVVGFENLRHVPGNLEVHVHVQLGLCAWPEKKTWKGSNLLCLVDLEDGHKPEMKTKAEWLKLQTAWWND